MLSYSFTMHITEAASLWKRKKYDGMIPAVELTGRSYYYFSVKWEIMDCIMNEEEYIYDGYYGQIT